MAEENNNGRQIDFIVNTLAQITSKVDALADVNAADRRRIARLEDGYELLIRMTEQQDSRMGQIETNMAEMSSGINKLVGAQSESNERLNVFINVLERYISGGNGKA
jgi:hypothetical protein